MQHLKNFLEFLNEQELTYTDVEVIIDNDDWWFATAYTTKSMDKLINDMFIKIYDQELYDYDELGATEKSIGEGKVYYVGYPKKEFRNHEDEICKAISVTLRVDKDNDYRPCLRFKNYWLSSEMYNPEMMPRVLSVDDLKVMFINNKDLSEITKPPKRLTNLEWVKKNIDVEHYKTYPWLSKEEKQKLKSRIIKHKFDL